MRKSQSSTASDQIEFRTKFLERLDKEFDVQRISKQFSDEEGKTMDVEMMDIQVDQPGASTSGGMSAQERPRKIMARKKIKEQAAGQKRRRSDSEFDESSPRSSIEMGRAY